MTINDKKPTVAIFCDLTKAFDCVNHEILLRQLKIYGFRGKILEWFASNLFDKNSQSQTVGDS